MRTSTNEYEGYIENKVSFWSKVEWATKPTDELIGIQINTYSHEEWTTLVVKKEHTHVFDNTINVNRQKSRNRPSKNPLRQDRKGNSELTDDWRSRSRVNVLGKQKQFYELGCLSYRSFISLCYGLCLRWHTSCTHRLYRLARFLPYILHEMVIILNFVQVTTWQNETTT